MAIKSEKEIREVIRGTDDFLKDPLARRTMPTTMWNRGYLSALKWVLNESD